MIYLDNAATTRVNESCGQVILKTMCKDFFNPAGLYAQAVSVENKIKDARRAIASYFGRQSDTVYFTSGGTESDNIAILGVHAAQRSGQWRYICGPSEHPAVYECFRRLESRGQDVVYLHCDDAGTVNLEELEEAVNERTVLVSVMHVNNEFGAVADLTAIQRAIAKKNPDTLLHSDGVQALLHLPDVQNPADLYSLSAHKFHGPKGAGALLRSKRSRAMGQLGGGQELGVRSGTLNSPGILGMAAVLEEGRSQLEARIHTMRRCKIRLAEGLLSFPDVLLNGPPLEDAVPHIVNLSIMGIRGEVLLHALEEKGIIVGTGSACGSRNRGENRVLASIGVTGQRAEAALRFSFSHENTEGEMDEVLNALSELIPYHRRFVPR